MVEAVPETVRAVEDAYGIVTWPEPKMTGWLLVMLMERVEPELIRYAPLANKLVPVLVAVPPMPTDVPK